MNQLKLGKKIEREHLPYFRKMKAYKQKTGKCPTESQFVEGIAKAHIKEFPKGNYYSELIKMEKKLKKK
jgi:hypothetical protein